MEYELYHASTRKHKYIKKIGNRYFYSQQEIQAYYDGKKSDTGPHFPAPKYAVMDGGYRVKGMAKSAADVAKKRQAFDVSNQAVGVTKIAAGETNRAITRRLEKGKSSISKNVDKPLESLKKHASKGKNFLKELVAPPKVKHKTVIKTGGSEKVTYK